MSTDIELLDIAVPLAKMCRYNGHCVGFKHYSIAEHCCHVSDHCSDKNKLWGLMHDSAEAYISDIPMPVKRAIPTIDEIEYNILNEICHRFPFKQAKIPQQVIEIDRRIQHDEKEQVMTYSHYDWGLIDMPPLGVEIQFWEPDKAFTEFCNRFMELTK